MMLNLYGEIVSQCWGDLSDHYGNVKLDAFVVMPNHAHGIVVIDYHVGNGLKPFPTKFQWQKSFHDHIIRGEQDLARIREYITNNPLRRNKLDPFL